MKYKIIGHCWLTAKKSFGIVITEGAVKDKKAYIGDVPGHDEKIDLLFICSFGQKIDVDIAQMIIDKHGVKRTFEVATN